MRNLRTSTAFCLAILVGMSSVAMTPIALAESAKQVASAKSQVQSKSVNINTASAEQLAAGLKGVGLKKAKAIIEYRNKVGKFVKVEQLAEVKGIGSATVEKNRALISLK
ncbi:ComEA family DNA-binding protein [Simiduia aestuariiviva]|uniref:Competence protein ComEA n=1 Tax=Simiduia aestuariiviva TaxID=1510459 RepID=A0A839UL57_9GAMM|nr:ComEA family DNA-binding protein [Simiduia aestuariiviva]MBB3168383.1 competence protein ComEA [Simiduia aestuariiviva]